MGDINLYMMDVSENSGTPKSSILIGFSIINHPFWGNPIFGNIHIYTILPGLIIIQNQPNVGVSMYISPIGIEKRACSIHIDVCMTIQL